MGGLLAFRVDNYDNTAEREQFRFLCSQLSAHYENSKDFCVFAGNYNIGCELDGLFIKKDAIIAIEFKNFGGHIIANENGEWTADDTIIKGGSRKTVLQQARINHSIVKKELKALGVEAKQIRDVPTLIVFHQPIDLENNLSATNKSWLHITDDNHFIEKLDDITCPKTNLSPLDIVCLAETLNLNPFYLAEFSNATSNGPTNPINSIKVLDDIKRSETDFMAIQSQKVDSDTDGIQAAETEETKDLMGFIRQVLDSILKNSEYNIIIYDGLKSQSYFSDYDFPVKKTYVIKVESEGIGVLSSKLGRFINQEVRPINDNTVCWQSGDLLKERGLSEPKDNSCITPNDYPSKESGSVAFHKSKTIIPHWLDRELFNSLGAVYSPEHERYEYNLDLDKDEIKVYLGTYFPRSYAEAFCVFDDLFKLPKYQQELKKTTDLRILDYGCGSGGELVGLLVALSKHFSKPIRISIIAIDGNEEALSSLKIILEQLQNNTHHYISLSCINKTILSENDLEIHEIKGYYHFILNSKMICELISKRVLKPDGYSKVAAILSPHLAENGLLYLLDVTTKNDNTNLYYPQLMNKSINSFVISNPDIVTLLPLACANWTDCDVACFIQQTFIVSHSKKKYDESRVCYRLLCKSSFRDLILTDLPSYKDKKHIIHPQRFKQADEAAICPKSQGGCTTIDSYKIKQ